MLPTVAFPEVFGLMIEPTESYTKSELDRFADAVITIKEIISECPEAFKTAPHFTPIDRVDEVGANRNLIFMRSLIICHHSTLIESIQAQLNQLQVSEIKNSYFGARESLGMN